MSKENAVISQKNEIVQKLVFANNRLLLSRSVTETAREHV